MILEPLLGKRLPDLRYDREPKFTSAKQTAKALERLIKAGEKCYVRLRPRADIYAMGDRARVLVHSQIEEIRSEGRCTYVPKIARKYDDFARRTFVRAEKCFVFEYEGDDENEPGLPIEVPVRHAIPLLRTLPEMFGFLFEEVDASELEITEVRVKPKAKASSKATGKASSKKDKAKEAKAKGTKDDGGEDKLPTPSGT
jgi:hypothetical protein